MSSDEDAEIVQAFLEESRENLDSVDQDLVALEVNPTDAALLARVFRTIHTVKGTCGFLGFENLERITHAGESLLSALRAGDVVADAAITTTLLRLVDATRSTLDRIETTGTDADADYGDLVVALNAHLEIATEAPTAAPAPDTQPAPEQPEVVAAANTETSVRVDVAVLDKLMDLVGELVQARNQIGEMTGEDDDGPLAATYQQLHLATGELQEGVMRARLQPIGTVTSKFRRVVRDLALELGKQVHIDIEGEAVGVDRAVNEALAGPLLHLVRNAVDHGIEAPDVRAAAGKPAEGTIRIRAFHEGGRVHVEITDDGAGIDKERLVSQALAGGVVDETAAAAFTERDVFDLMFRPGLSTKREITSVSGRGVGLDVVRASLERFGGSVEVTSEFGHGCVFRLSVPLTLAIMPAVVTASGGERYTIPQVDVEEVLHLEAAQAAADVHTIEGARVLRLRGRLLPLVDLSEQLGGTPSARDRGVTIVMLCSAGKRYGLIVDEVGDMTEVVVKPLPSATCSVPAFAGVTILGDGRPSLILDVSGVASLAGVVSETDTAPADEEASLPDSGDDVLVAVGTDGGRLAVRLDAVRRLESFDTAAIEPMGAHDVVQYRDAILPLLYRGASERPVGGTVQTVVCETSIGLVGLVVARIEDIVAEGPLPVQPPSRAGVAASLIVEERVTELVDLEALVAAASLRSA
jgi:two-component system chemotaxis sensor kinase CheA